MINTHYLKELRCDSLPKRRGDKDADVTRVQEWINLQKYTDGSFQITISIDGDFGPATESAVKAFQDHQQLAVDGIVGPITWGALTEPMQRGYSKLIFTEETTFAQRVIDYAHQHLSQHPTEFNPNRGPWVRSYCYGNDGRQFPWCAGFVTTIVDMAADSVGRNVEHYMENSLSCDFILKDALAGNKHQVHIRAAAVKQDATLVDPGDLFLVINRNNPMDATHIGIVVGISGSVITTVEGNTNDEGSREGVEVCKRFRDLATGAYDIIKLYQRF